MADEDLPLSAEARFSEALAQLPAVERSALALSEIGGLDNNEIAERLGTDPLVVRKLLVRARETVKTSLAVNGRRGLSALLPFQNWWQTGSSAPAVRAAGVVAAAVVGSSVAIGGAAADSPRPPLISPDPPHARAFARQVHDAFVGAAREPVRVGVATAAASVVATKRTAGAPGAGKRSVRPGGGLQRDRDAPATSVQRPVHPVLADTAEPDAGPGQTAAGGHPAPPPAPVPVSAKETVARTVPVPVTVIPVAPLPPPPPVELPVIPQPPPVPVVPAPVPELPKLPPPPPLP